MDFNDTNGIYSKSNFFSSGSPRVHLAKDLNLNENYRQYAYPSHEHENQNRPTDYRQNKRETEEFEDIPVRDPRTFERKTEFPEKYNYEAYYRQDTNEAADVTPAFKEETKPKKVPKKSSKTHKSKETRSVSRESDKKQLRKEVSEARQRLNKLSELKAEENKYQPLESPYKNDYAEAMEKNTSIKSDIMNQNDKIKVLMRNYESLSRDYQEMNHKYTGVLGEFESLKFQFESSEEIRREQFDLIKAMQLEIDCLKLKLREKKEEPKQKKKKLKK